MPFRSEAQRRAMHSAAEGRGTLGIPPSAARRFIRHSRTKNKGGVLQRAKHKMCGS